MIKSSKIAIGAALAGAFVLGATVIAFSSAQQSAPAEDMQSHSPAYTPAANLDTAFSDLEEEDIRKIVRNYLMTNPEIIIEAVNAYSAREQLRAETQANDVAAANLGALLDPATSYVTGKNPGKAKVAVVEMYDYHCGYCKRATPFIKDIVKKDADVKVVFRELPILHEESGYAAAVSLGARDQSKFIELHFAMMDASGILTKDRVAALAKKEGVDISKIETRIEQPDISAAISGNHDIAAQMGVDGTPTFIVAAIDGSYVEVVSGFRPDELKEKIAAAKKASK
ncbi:MAG: hypothetical protein DHS20C05_15530 [Hyphococcus sp.]|nr:MAG: hypothetical protein DHS20C05_15530 [Marinicaulis sp.]